MEGLPHEVGGRIYPQGWRYRALTDRLSVYQDIVFSNADGAINETTVHAEMLVGLEVFDKPEAGSSGRLSAWFNDATRWINGRLGVGNNGELSMQHVGPELGNDLYTHMLERAVEHQTWLSLAQVAIALERHQHLHERYPENLASLVPEFLPEVPPDLWAKTVGDNLRYVIRPGGRPAVWSVGSNRNDDGGWIADDDRDTLWQYELAPDDPGPKRYADPNIPNRRRRRPAREIWR
jgi:hypothetical protein